MVISVGRLLQTFCCDSTWYTCVYVVQPVRFVIIALSNSQSDLSVKSLKSKDFKEGEKET